MRQYRVEIVHRDSGWEESLNLAAVKVYGAHLGAQQCELNMREHLDGAVGVDCCLVD
jgi:hypothetical protein